MDFPAQGYLFQYNALELPETGYLTSFLTNGGSLWIDSQDLTVQSAAAGMISAVSGRLPREDGQCLALRADFPFELSRRDPEDAQYPVHKRDRRPARHHERRHEQRVHQGPPPISDVSDSGGDGRNSLNWGSEMNPLNITEILPPSSPGNLCRHRRYDRQPILRHAEILFTGATAPLMLGGQAIFFSWPFESVDHLGNITNDTTGRAYILKAAIDWLAGVPAPLPGPVSNMLPANGSTTTTLLPVLSWTAGLDATSYIIEYGAGDTLPVSPNTVPLAATSYTLPAALMAGTTYTWPVISVNANGTTLGPVQSFIAHAATGGGGSTGTGTGTTGTGTDTGTGTGTATGGGGGGGGGGCFIATAGYESPERRLDGIVETNCTGSYVIAPERLRQLNDIRAMRDDLLLHFPAGRAFSAWYYAIGPYAAEAIRDNEPAKAAVRAMVLNPLAELSRECEQTEKMIHRPGRPAEVMPMIVSRRRRADRFSSAALVCLAAGLCGAAWFALKPPAPVEPSRAPAAAPSVSAPAPAAPAADNLSILWQGATDVSAASGGPSSPAAGLPALAGDAPPFTVRGMIASLSGSSSVAFIQSASGASMIRQGEVADGWKLMGVTENAATFAREDRAITLSLAKPEYDAAGGGAPASAGSGPSSAPRFPQPAPVAAATRRCRRARSRRAAPAPQRLQPPSDRPRPRRSKSSCLKASWTRSGRIPSPPCRAYQIHMVNGQMQGYTVANVSSDSLAAPYVSSGDRILAVNGAPINSAGAAMNIYQQLTASGATSVTVTMERGGQRLNVVYTIK